MKVAVVGRTGLAGGHVVEILRARGVETVVASRSSAVDVTTGAGLDEALTGVQRVIDTTNAGTTDGDAASAFFTTAAEHLQRAAERAGVERIVVLSIIGVDRLSSGYFAAKFQHERAARSGAVPVVVLRAAQFHEFAGQVLLWGRDGDVSRVRRCPCSRSLWPARLRSSQTWRSPTTLPPPFPRWPGRPSSSWWTWPPALQPGGATP
jgi:hypothetical protein